MTPCPFVLFTSSLLCASFCILLACVRCDTCGTSGTFLITRHPPVNSVTCRLFSLLHCSELFCLLDAFLGYPTSSWSPALSWMITDQGSPCSSVPSHPFRVLLAARRPRDYSSHPWLLCYPFWRLGSLLVPGDFLSALAH